MHFPVYIVIGSLKLHPHAVFEALSYFIGFRLYLWTRRKERLPQRKAAWVAVGAVLGAAVGSKLLFWLEDPATTWAHWNDYAYLMGGKTIVGGLLGGLIGVEWTKARIGVTRSTGDDFVYPLIIGMCIGRIGCFLTGLDDHTYGNPTSWWTGVDFGDGIPRHPTQLYEIAFLLMLAIGLAVGERKRRADGRTWPEGTRFQLFMIAYLGFRLAIDAVKPTPHVYAGLNNIQVAAIAGLLYYAYVFIRRLRPGRTPAWSEEE